MSGLDLFKLVRQPEYGTNEPYLIDFIEICLCPKLLNPAKIRDLYENYAQSKAQIAAHFGVSESAITARLRHVGIHGGTGKGRATNPNNYRHRVVPYGYSNKGGKLVLNKAEMRICKLVVELIQREGRNQCEVARELSRRGFKNRAGKSDWNSKSVFNIFKRWKDKI